MKNINFLTDWICSIVRFVKCAGSGGGEGSLLTGWAGFSRIDLWDFFKEFRCSSWFIRESLLRDMCSWGNCISLCLQREREHVSFNKHSLVYNCMNTVHDLHKAYYCVTQQHLHACFINTCTCMFHQYMYMHASSIHISYTCTYIHTRVHSLKLYNINNDGS